MKLSLILKAIDQWSKPTDKAAKSTGGLTKATGELTKRTGFLDRVVARARGTISRFWNDSARGERIGQRVGLAMRTLALRGFDLVKRSAEGATRATGCLLLGLVKLGARTLAYGAAGVAAGGLAIGSMLARGVITNGAQFEQYQVALEGTEGSAKKARKAMEWVKDFAKTTPYEIEEVTDAFVRARGVGLDPTTGSFRILGDAAGATRKTLMDAIEMMADAQTGEFERLKEFNITASVKGQAVTFSYLDKAGKNASKTVKKNMTSIRKAILDVFEAKYSGGMERQSKTLIGIWNNLKDSITNFELSIAGKGIFDRVKSSLQRALDWISSPKNSAQIEQWAQRVSDWMTTIWDRAEKFINETDWKSVATGIGTIVSALVTAVEWIGKAATAWGAWQNDVERRRLSQVINSTGVWGTGLGEASPAEKAQARRDLDRLEGRAPPPRSSAPVKWPTLPAGSPNGWKAPGRAPAAPDGKISLEIKPVPGWSIRPAGIAATGMQLNVNTGKAMAGPA